MCAVYNQNANGIPWGIDGQRSGLVRHPRCGGCVGSHGFAPDTSVRSKIVVEGGARGLLGGLVCLHGGIRGLHRTENSLRSFARCPCPCCRRCRLHIPYCGLLAGARSHELGTRGDEVYFWFVDFHSRGRRGHSASCKRPSLTSRGPAKPTLVTLGRRLRQHGACQRGAARLVIKLNRIIGFIILVAVVYGMLQACGLLPENAPQLFPQRSGSPAA